MEDLLSGLIFFQPNVDVNLHIQQATESLHKNYLNKVDALPALVEIVKRNQHWQVRQSAALELKKAASRHWSDAAAADSFKEDLKQKVLDHLLVESDARVRQALSRALEPIAKSDIPAGKWPALMQFIEFCVNSDQEARKETGMLILFNLVETIPDSFASSMESVFQLFTAGLKDSSLEVRIISFKGLGAIGCLLEKDQKVMVEGLKALIPEMVTVLQQVLAVPSKVDVGVQMIEVFDSLMMSDAPILNSHAIALIQMFVEIAANTNHLDDIRVMALNFLMWAIVYKKQRIIKENIIEPIVKVIMPIGLEPFEDEDDEDCPPKMAFSLIHTMALNLPSQHVFGPIMQMAVEYMKSPESNHRLAGMMSMAKIMEGCPDDFQTVLGNVITLIVGGMQDSEAAVKKASCLALSNLGEYLGDEVSMYHAQLMPVLSTVLMDQREDVQRYACLATDFLIENLGPQEIRIYSENLMTILFKLLQSEESSIQNKSSAMGAIGSIANVMGSDFAPYFGHVVPLLVKSCELAEVDQLPLRSMAIDSTGTIAAAVGKDVFAPYLESFMVSAVHGLGLDNSRLRECSYIFFGQISELFETEFSKYLEVIVGELFKSINLSEEGKIYYV